MPLNASESGAHGKGSSLRGEIGTCRLGRPRGTRAEMAPAGAAISPAGKEACKKSAMECAQQPNPGTLPPQQLQPTIALSALSAQQAVATALCRSTAVLAGMLSRMYPHVRSTAVLAAGGVQPSAPRGKLSKRTALQALYLRG